MPTEAVLKLMIAQLDYEIKSLNRAMNNDMSWIEISVLSTMLSIAEAKRDALVRALETL